LRLYEIYKTIFPNGEYYIGQHLLPDGRTEHSQYFGSGIRPKRYLKLHGKGNTIKQQLAILPTEKLANIAEILYISFYKSDLNCLNIAKGGAGASGFEIPQEQRDKFSIAHKGRKGYINIETGTAIYLKEGDTVPESFIRGSNNRGYLWANNGIKNIKVWNGILPENCKWGKLPWTNEQRQRVTGKKGKPQTSELKERHRQSTILLWGNPEFRKKVAEGMKKHPHGHLSVPIHNKGKAQYNNGIDQIYLRPGDPVPDGYSLGGLQRPNRHFNATDDFKKKVSLNNSRTVFYRVFNIETTEVHFIAGTPAIGKLLGITAGQAASVLCRGLTPKRGRLFDIFNKWEFHKITKEEYIQEVS